MLATTAATTPAVLATEDKFAIGMKEGVVLLMKDN